MQLIYGSYQHEADEVSVAISRRGLVNSAGLLYGHLEQWQISGFLQGDDQAALTTKIAALRTAYATPGRDLTLKLNDGSDSAHKLTTANTIGGVRIVDGPSFPQGAGAEYSTFRSYTIVVEAEVPNASRQTDIVAWTETVTIQGGGPRFVLISTLSGRPQKQLVAQATPVLATQSGSAVGYSRYPFPPLPLWPRHEHVDRRQISRIAPKRIGSGASLAYTDWAVQWTYTFESADPLIGAPTRQPTSA